VGIVGAMETNPEEIVFEQNFVTSLEERNISFNPAMLNLFFLVSTAAYRQGQDAGVTCFKEMMDNTQDVRKIFFSHILTFFSIVLTKPTIDHKKVFAVLNAQDCFVSFSKLFNADPIAAHERKEKIFQATDMLLLKLISHYYLEDRDFCALHRRLKDAVRFTMHCNDDYVKQQVKEISELFIYCLAVQSIDALFYLPHHAYSHALWENMQNLVVTIEKYATSVKSKENTNKKNPSSKTETEGASSQLLQQDDLFGKISQTFTNYLLRGIEKEPSL
jgi:hypothetical protein